MSIDAVIAALGQAEQVRSERFADLFFRGRRSQRPLVLQGLGRPVRHVRICGGKNTPLELEGIAVRDGGEDLLPLSLKTSTVAGGFDAKVQDMAVFRNTGESVALATQTGGQEWASFELPRTAEDLVLTVHARDDRYTQRAWGLAVDVSTDGQDWTRVYSHIDRLVAYQKAIAPFFAAKEEPARSALAAAHQIVVAIVQGSSEAARPMLDKSAFAEADRRRIKAALNQGLLRTLHREWTSHGIQRSFRYWSPREKADYLRNAKDVVADLAGLTPLACFGFGFVLGMLRSGDFIPHDDDIDLIIGLPHRPGARLATELERVRNHLRAKGYVVSGEHFNHVHVRKASWIHVFDVFVGFVEGDRASWFPSARRGLAVEWVFPAQRINLLGVDCLFPAQPEAYLAATYGEGWRDPDPNFMHPWDRGQYKDLA